MGLRRTWLALLLCLVAGDGQGAPELVEVEMVCGISGLKGGAAARDSVELILSRGKDYGVRVGSRGPVFSPMNHDLVRTRVGLAEVISVEPRSARARFAPGDGATEQPIAGGHVVLPVLVPADVHRGLLFDMLQRGVTLLDNRHRPIVPPDKLLAARTPNVENQALARMVAAGRELAKLIDDQRLVSHGKWTAARPQEVLRHADAEDYKALLRYIRDYGSPLFGTEREVSGLFLHWIEIDMPPSKEDEVTELLAMPEGPAFVQRAQDLGDGLEGFVKYVRQKMDNWPQSRADEAQQRVALLDRVLRVQKGKVSPAAMALAEDARADALWLVPGKRAETAAAYRRAAAAYAQSGGVAEEIIALEHSARALLGAQDPDAVLRLAPDIFALCAKARAASKDPVILSVVSSEEAMAAELVASIAYSRGDYKRVIADLLPFAERLARHGQINTRAHAMRLLHLVGEAHLKLGNFEDAGKVFERWRVLASETHKTSEEARVAYALGEALEGATKYEAALSEYERSAALAHAANEDSDVANALAASGQMLWKLGRGPEAIARHEAGMKIRKALGKKGPLAWQLVRVGRIRVEAGDREQARRDFEEALRLYQEVGDRAAHADVQAELGELFVAVHNDDAAEKVLESAKATYVALGQKADESRVTWDLSNVWGHRKVPARALALARRALELDQQIGMTDRVGLDMLFLAYRLLDTGDHAGADAMMERALPVMEKYPGLRSDALVMLAIDAILRGDWDVARRRAGEARVVAEAIKDNGRLLNALRIGADVAAKVADYDTALDAYDKVSVLAKQAGDRPQQQKALYHKGWWLVSVGRLAEAHRTAEEAADLAEKNGDPVEKAWTLSLLAHVDSAGGDLRGQLEHIEAAVPLMHATGDRYGEAAMILNRASALIDLRDIDGALAANRTATELHPSDSTSELSLVLAMQRATILELRDQFAAAETPLKEALTIARKWFPGRVVGLLEDLAHLQAQRGAHRESIATLQEPLKIEAARTDKPYGALATLGYVQALAGDDAAAESSLAEAAARAQAREGALPWETLYYLGLVRSRLGKNAAALSALELCVSEIDRGEAAVLKHALHEGEEIGAQPVDGDRALARYRADKLDAYRLIVKLLLSKGRVEDALRYHERSKQAELKDLAHRAEGVDDDASAAGSEFDAQETSLRELVDRERFKARPNPTRLGKLEAMLAAIRRRRAAFVDKLERENPRLFDRFAVRPLDLEKLQKFLPANVLLVSPVVLDDRVVVFAVTSKGITHVETLVKSEAVTQEVTALLAEIDPDKLLGRRARSATVVNAPPATPRLPPAQAVRESLDRVKGPSRRLYDLLLRPVFDLLGTPELLAVSASTMLRYVPVAALSDGEKLVAERMAVVSVSSLGSYELAAHPAARGTPTVLALADPDGSLPAARAEIDAIRAVVKKIRVYEGPEATLGRLRSEVAERGYDIVHLATHGRLDATNPELSSILLAGGALTYGDIPTLDLRKSRLVVLSACSTEAKVAGSGIEIAGLAQQFERANASAVLATLWAVDDVATSVLMGSFYQAIRAGRTPSQSLVLAQRNLLSGSNEVYRHPAFWAPFVLMGSQ